jgi:hypothetical protein
MEQYRTIYLDEILRHEGRGDYIHQEICPDCFSLNEETPGGAEYRCKDCFLRDLVCQACCVRRHRVNPFHRIEVSNILFSHITHSPQRWTGEYFETCTLKSLGQRIQLNHHSMRCPAPIPAHSDLCVYHFGLHNIQIDYCGCHKQVPHYIQLLRSGLYPATQNTPKTCATFPFLEYFHIHSLESKCNVSNSHRTAIKLTDNTGTTSTRKRYRPLMHMTMQWRHLKLLKRGGRGHAESGVAGTQLGELALLCPSCPYPGINLPDNWEGQQDAWKFAVMAAQDANFRLKEQLVSSWSRDPGLGVGWAYWAQRAGFEQYQLSRATDEDVRISSIFQSNANFYQISTCVGFQALAKANTRFSRGLRYTGVAAVACARSEMVFPNALGNMVKGERYDMFTSSFSSA